MATFIASTAQLTCTYGDKKSQLTVLPTRTIFLNGNPMANVSDHKPIINIGPFGKCRSLANPAVAAATAAHHGHLTPMPCIPNTPQPWIKGKTNVIEKNNPALIKDCKLHCMWAGVISIISDGQTGIGVQTIHKVSKRTFNQVKNDGTGVNGDSSIKITYDTEMTDTNVPNTKQSPLPINNPKYIKADDFNISTKDAEKILPSFTKYSIEEQEFILKIANNTIINNSLDLKKIRLKSAEEYLLLYKKQGLPTNLSDQQTTAISNNNDELEKALSIKKGSPMTVANADKQKANPLLSTNVNYEINCVTTTATYLLRLRGFDVTAKPRGQKNTDHLAGNRFDMWRNSDGTDVEPTNTLSWMKNKGYKEMNAERYMDFFNETCKDPGIYQLSINWEAGGGHSTILQRFTNGELRYIEPQRDILSDKSRDIKWLSQQGAKIPVGERGILRIDDKVFNTDYSDIFDTK